MLDFLKWLHSEIFLLDKGIAIVFALASVTLFTALLVGYSMRNAGVYAGGGALVGGGIVLFVIFGNKEWERVSVLLAVLAILGGGAYIALVCALECKKAWRKKREAKETSLKRLEYTLPDKENSFIRERLNTVLKTGENEGEKAETYFRFVHACKLLAKVREKPLSTAERLETDEIDALFKAFLKKEKWNFEDVRIVNEAFARILKLSAKYAV